MFEGIFQPMHLLIIFGIVLLIFGPNKLPELGKGLGQSIRSFKEAMNQTEEENKKLDDKNPKQLELRIGTNPDNIRRLYLK